MMRHLNNAMKANAQMVAQSKASTRHGTVSSYDPGAYAVKVTLQPDGVTTGWLPLKSIWIGNSWGLMCGPSIGDAVEIDYQEGNSGVGSVGMRFFNDQDRPLPCPSGDFWLVHKSGSSLKFNGDGSVELVAKADLNAKVGGNLNATVDGSAAITAIGDMALKAAKLTVDAITTFTKAVTVQGLLTYVAGMAGSNNGSGKGAEIAGGIKNTGGSIISNAIDLEGHRHTAQGQNAQTTKAQ